MSLALSRNEPIDKSYMALIRRFPLRPLRNDYDLDIASELLGDIGILGNKKTPGEQDYMDVLAQLIANYEKHSPTLQRLLTGSPRLSAREILQSFLTDHKLSQSELARNIGCMPSVLSDFLSGRRGLSKTNALKLGKYFAVDATLFLR